MTDKQRNIFDELLEDAIASLPPKFRAVLDEIPVIAIDRPDKAMIQSLIKDGVIDPGELTDGNDDGGLCGLHSGVAITDRSNADSGVLPPQIHIFRDGIVEFAGGWAQKHAEDEIYEEVRITLLHEIGHHFGLDEDDLEELGYA